MLFFARFFLKKFLTYFFLKSIKLNGLMPTWLLHPAEMSQKNQKSVKGTMEPLSLTQIKVAPLSVLQIQKKIIPSHQAELHAAVDEAMKTIARGFGSKAESTGHVQMMNRDGSPVVGAVFSHADVMPKNYVKKYRGKKVICDMPCCTVYHPVPAQMNFHTAVTSAVEHEPQTGWIKVESRSKRNKRLRAAHQRKQQNEYLYSQDEEDEYLE